MLLTVKTIKIDVISIRVKFIIFATKIENSILAGVINLENNGLLLLHVYKLFKVLGNLYLWLF
jgi:hypothetical protein